MPLKDIVVFVDTLPQCAERLRVTALLARRNDAHLAGVHVAALPRLSPEIEIAPAVIANREYLERLEQDIAAAERSFRDFLDRERLNGEWRVARGFPADEAALHARYADLSVVGQDSPDQDVWTVLPEDVALASGRPALVVPYAGRFPTIGENVLIAWKPSPESARAVNDAIPLIAGAREVRILAINARAERWGHGEEPGADIALHLARHGIKATVEQITTEELDVGDALLSRAADLGSDLIVMGCYGHSRLRELVLGGATRNVLKQMTVPVLMSH